MQSAEKPVYVYVPLTFHADSFDQLKGLENEAYWFVWKVISGASRRKHDQGFDGMVPIHRETMKKFIASRHVSTVRDTLIAEGVVVCNESYQKADPKKGIEGFSQTYGLTEAYAGDFRRVQITKRTLAARILANRVEIQNRPVDQIDLDYTLDHLKRWLRRLRIDSASAYEIIQTSDFKPARIIRRKVGRRNRRKFVRVAIPDSRSLNRMVVHTIDDEDWEWEVCRYGRVHTNVTRLMTECRSCLSIDGDSLVGADIKNSQLIFLLILLLESRTREAGVEKEERETHPLCGDTPVGQIDQYDPYLTDDEREFKRLVLNGTIYNVLMLDTGYTDRKAFKGSFFEGVLYGDNSAYYSFMNPITRAFKRRFPSVWKFILDSKKWDGKTGKEKDALKNLAREMQRRESRFMIGRVCGRLAAYHPEIPLITVHDSVMTPPRYMPTVERIMYEEFWRIGVRPKIEVQPSEQDAEQAA